MTFKNTFILLAFFFAALPCFAIEEKTAFECITHLETGSINWSTGKVTVTGKAKALPEKSLESIPGQARAEANKNIIDILKTIKINNRLSVGKYASTNDILLAGIEKTAMDAVIIKQLYTSNGSLELTIETSIFGGFLQIVLPEEIRQITQINTVETKEKKPKLDKIENYYTGLIVDASQLEFIPVLYPVIMSEQGAEVYSSALISRDYAVQHGVCKYVCDVDRAIADERSGTKPLIIKGLRTEPKENSFIVISTSDADAIEKIDERHQFFKQCKVIIVLGQ